MCMCMVSQFVQRRGYCELMLIKKVLVSIDGTVFLIRCSCNYEREDRGDNERMKWQVHSQRATQHQSVRVTHTVQYSTVQYSAIIIVT